MSIEIGDGGLGYIYLGDILIAGGGGGDKTQTFDFQNDGDLGWTISYNTSYSYSGIESGQGFYTQSKNNNIDTASIQMPNNLQSGTLSKIKIRYYLPNTKTAAGINGGSTYSGFSWAENAGTLGLGNSTPLTIGNYSGELITEYNITSTGCSGTCAGVPFTFATNEANDFITAYNNKTLKLYMVTRRQTSKTYIRKVEITTV